MDRPKTVELFAQARTAIRAANDDPADPGAITALCDACECMARILGELLCDQIPTGARPA